MTNDSTRYEGSHEANNPSDTNDTGDICTSPAHLDNGNGVLRKGRFHSIKVTEENWVRPPTRNASIISNICSQWNDADVANGATNSTPTGDRLQKLDVTSSVVTSNSEKDMLNYMNRKNIPETDYYRSIEKGRGKAEKDCFGSRFARRFLDTVRDPRKLGFQHICLILLVLSYTLLGAAIFYVIESNYERKMVAIRKAALEEKILDIAKEMTTAINDPDQTVTVQTMVTYLKNGYKTLLKEEAAYVDSTFYKDEDPNNHMKWTFGSSFFFSMNVFTTTGYGSIAPESVLGKSCVIVYGFLFVPLTLVVIRHLGNWTLVVLTNIYANIVIRWRKIRSKHDVTNGEMFTLPVFLCMSIMFVYLMGTTTFIFIYDRLSGPPGTGINYFLSFYFSFISISTIGLGDVMPTNVTFDPLITILFFFGMPLMKVVNSSTYQCVERTTIGILTFFENRLLQFGQGSRNDGVVNEPTKPRCMTLTGSNAPDLKEDTQNDIAIRSLLTFIKSDAHMYGHHFGRVNLTAKTDTL